MRTAIHAEPLIQDLEVTDRAIIVQLVDGRVVSVPLEWSWRLSHATPAERTNFQISSDGAYVHWPDVDEDLSAQGMLTGTPAPRPPSSADSHLSKKRVRLASKKPAVTRRRRVSD